jgi:hypothetical protein
MEHEAWVKAAAADGSITAAEPQVSNLCAQPSFTALLRMGR